MLSFAVAIQDQQPPQNPLSLFLRPRPPHRKHLPALALHLLVPLALLSNRPPPRLKHSLLLPTPLTLRSASRFFPRDSDYF
jgi:hypothetical protein